MRARGFSLLEVMMAVAILGLALTVILSAQGGLAASNKSAANMGMAATLGRCKMTELEERLLKLGYPEMDDLNGEVPCCGDTDTPGFTCDTRVEKVVLPNPPDNSLDGGSPLALSSAAGSAAANPAALGSALPGPLGSIAAQALGPAGGAGLDLQDGGLAALGSTVQQQMGLGGPGGAGGAGAQGLLNMVMGMVYPSVKLMMEASIRRVTVTVKWHEGPNAKELGIVQYVTNPQRGGFMAGGMMGDGGVPPGGGAAGGGGVPVMNPSTPGPSGVGR